jgi:hypothetical protein
MSMVDFVIVLLLGPLLMGWLCVEAAAWAERHS